MLRRSGGGLVLFAESNAAPGGGDDGGNGGDVASSASFEGKSACFELGGFGNSVRIWTTSLMVGRSTA